MARGGVGAWLGGGWGCDRGRRSLVRPGVDLEVGLGAEGMGAPSVSASLLSLPRVWDSSQLTPNQRHIHLVEIKYCKDTSPGASSKPPIESTMCSFSTFNESTSTLIFVDLHTDLWEQVFPSTALSMETPKTHSMNAMKLLVHCLCMLIHVSFRQIARWIDCRIIKESDIVQAARCCPVLWGYTHSM